MPKEIVIPVPTTVDSELTDTLTTHMADAYGGFTVLKGQGGWLSPSGERITEPVDVFTCVASDDADRKPESFAKVSAQFLANETDEESVMWYVNPVTSHGFETET